MPPNNPNHHPLTCASARVVDYSNAQAGRHARGGLQSCGVFATLVARRRPLVVDACLRWRLLPCCGLLLARHVRGRVDAGYCIWSSMVEKAALSVSDLLDLISRHVRVLAVLQKLGKWGVPSSARAVLEVFDEFEQRAQWLACHARGVSLWRSASSSVLVRAVSGVRARPPERSRRHRHAVNSHRVIGIGGCVVLLLARKTGAAVAGWPRAVVACIA
jgi:hypothetical protein